MVKRKDIQDYERLGNIALKNKTLAMAGPLLLLVEKPDTIANSDNTCDESR